MWGFAAGSPRRFAPDKHVETRFNEPATPLETGLEAQAVNRNTDADGSTGRPRFDPGSRRLGRSGTLVANRMVRARGGLNAARLVGDRLVFRLGPGGRRTDRRFELLQVRQDAIVDFDCSIRLVTGEIDALERVPGGIVELTVLGATIAADAAKFGLRVANEDPPNFNIHPAEGFDHLRQ